MEIQHELEKALELERVKTRRSYKSGVHEEHGHAHHQPEGHSPAGQAGAAGGAAGEVEVINKTPH